MFLTDDICYVDMPKTGTVYTINVLKKLYKNYFLKHHKIPNSQIINSNREIFATIRDPFSYYISLWSFGCEKQSYSGPYNALTQFRPIGALGYSMNKKGAIKTFFQRLPRTLLTNYKENKKLYADASDPVLFRKWLKVLFDTRNASLISAPYQYSNVAQCGGLFTYRIILNFYKNSDQLFKGKFKTKDDFKNFLQKDCFVQYFLNTSSLRDDLYSFLKQRHENLTEDILPQKKENSSAKENIIFFDKECYEMVLKKDSLIIEQFCKRINLKLPKMGEV
jgi:hypothetical protein